MKKNDTFEITIEDMGTSGEGIGHYGGMTFFLKDAIVGDRVLAGVTKLKTNYGFARVVDIIEPSPYRVTPKCPISKTCGGCQIQALDYRQQLTLKEKMVYNHLLRIGGFAREELDRVMEPIVGMKEPYHYRNKAQFPVGLDKDGHVIMGFYKARSHNIIPTEQCFLGVIENEQVLAIVKKYMQQNQVKPYDETTGKGLLRHVLIRYGFTSKEIMVCLVVNGNTLPREEELCEALAAISGMTSISININTQKTNVILGDQTRCCWGREYISDTIHRVVEDENHPGEFTATSEGVEFQISPKSFYQVNPVQTEKLYSLALEYAGLTGQEIVWDLYCGIGTISLFLAKETKKVYGVEIVPEAIEDARRNAKVNHIENVEFYVGKAEEVLPDFYAGKIKSREILSDDNVRNPEAEMNKDATRDKSEERARHPDVIVVDPPRKGCDALCLSTMLKMQPGRIVYVSCDSATLARDLKILAQGGYQPDRIRPVDQFCHSVHTEVVVCLQKKGSP